MKAVNKFKSLFVIITFSVFCFCSVVRASYLAPAPTDTSGPTTGEPNGEGPTPCEAQDNIIFFLFKSIMKATGPTPSQGASCTINSPA